MDVEEVNELETNQIDNSNNNHFLYDDVEIQLEYYDEILQEHIIYQDMQIENDKIDENSDSLKIDIGPLIQKYVTNEINFNDIAKNNLNYNAINRELKVIYFEQF